MTTSNFNRKELVLTSTRSLLYGPVATGMTSIIFSGTFSNIDSTLQQDHYLTLEVQNASLVYMARLHKVPIPYGGTSKCPKTVLLPGESLYVTADLPNVVTAMVDILERT